MMFLFPLLFISALTFSYMLLSCLLCEHAFDFDFVPRFLYFVDLGLLVYGGTEDASV